jgi:hypothetical protein
MPLGLLPTESGAPTTVFVAVSITEIEPAPLFVT